MAGVRTECLYRIDDGSVIEHGPPCGLLIPIETEIAASNDMMATTHAFVSLAVAVLSLPVLSEYASPPLLLGAAFVGGLAPDVDLAAEHRKTLHYPLAAPALALALSGVAFATSSAFATLAAVAVGGAALHAVSDVLAGSPEHEPWNPSLDRSVYNHLLGRWHPARRYVRYSGAPEDFFAGLTFASVAILSPATSPATDLSIAGLLAVSGLFSLYRKRLHYVVDRFESMRSTFRSRQ